ncbi:hypothetical protein HOE425_320277 [Hoeflea sp. EC-HK425]|nr:hypothetical protein HOE425_320277 [Hoeflea sp. EC-HK425]
MISAKRPIMPTVSCHAGILDLDINPPRSNSQISFPLQRCGIVARTVRRLFPVPGPETERTQANSLMQQVVCARYSNFRQSPSRLWSSLRIFSASSGAPVVCSRMILTGDGMSARP